MSFMAEWGISSSPCHVSAFPTSLFFLPLSPEGAPKGGEVGSTGVGEADGRLREFSVNYLVCLGLLCVIVCNSF